MKILTLLGSARKKGNTVTVLGWIEDELRSSDHDVDRIDLTKKNINGCLGCANCRKVPDKLDCVQDDDAGPIFKKMLNSDAVIYACPLYFWGFSAQMKALIDRSYCLVREYGTPEHSSFIEGQRHAILVTGAGGYENNAEQIFTSFRRIVDWAKASPSGELFVGNCTTPDELSDEVRERARKFARQLAG